MNRPTALTAAMLGLVALLAACGSTASKSGSTVATTNAPAVSSPAGQSSATTVLSPTVPSTTATRVSADPNIDPQFCVLIKQYAADSASFGNSTTTDEFKARLPVVVKELTEIAAASPASVKADVSAAATAMTHLDAALAAVGYDPSKITENTAVQAATVELSGVDEQQFEAVAQANCGISLNGSSGSSSAATPPAT